MWFTLLLFISCCWNCFQLESNVEVSIKIAGKLYGIRGSTISVNNVKSFNERTGTYDNFNKLTTINYFAKIPYAKPPIGKRRFQKPEPLDIPPWHGVFDARKPPNSCYQGLPYSDFDKFNPAANMWFIKTNMSEDCLYLTIWTPDVKPTKALPVMIWIYGGSYMAGGSSLEVYDGSVLSAFQNVVVLSFQYRMGPFGFFYLNEELSGGNQALKDQQMVFEWVRDHVHQFGGDPNQVTLFGESSGATLISIHMVSARTKHLFHRVILQSGTILAPWAIESKASALERSLYLAKSANCSRWSYASTLECVQSISATDIVNYNFKIRDQIAEQRRIHLRRQNYSPLYSIGALFFDVYFRPVIDEAFVTSQNIEEVERGESYINKDILLGTNTNEAIFFIIYGLSGDFKFLNKSQILEPRRLSYPMVDFIDPNQLMMENMLDMDYMYQGLVHLIMYEYRIRSKWFGDVEWNARDLLMKLDQIGGDTQFICSTIQFADSIVQSSTNKQVYMYWFDYRTSQSPTPSWCGVMHGYEIEYVFGSPFNNKFSQLYYRFTDRERQASKYIMQMWANFARYGNPTQIGLADNFYWMPYTQTNKKFLRISDKTQTILSMNDEYKLRECRFWNKVVPSIKSQIKRASQIQSSIEKLNLMVVIILIIKNSCQ